MIVVMIEELCSIINNLKMLYNAFRYLYVLEGGYWIIV